MAIYYETFGQTIDSKEGPTPRIRIDVIKNGDIGVDGTSKGKQGYIYMSSIPAMVISVDGIKEINAGEIIEAGSKGFILIEKERFDQLGNDGVIFGKTISQWTNEFKKDDSPQETLNPNNPVKRLKNIGSRIATSVRGS